VEEVAVKYVKEEEEEADFTCPECGVEYTWKELLDLSYGVCTTCNVVIFKKPIETSRPHDFSKPLGAMIVDELIEDLISSEYDPIEKPEGYNQGKIEVIDFLEDKALDFRLSNVIKYVCREAFKNGLEDLKKARWYLDRVIKERE
jgi:hypothetical protein